VTRRPAVGAAVGLLAALLAGCSGGDDHPGPAPTTAVSVAPSSARTPPPISPRTTVSFAPGSSLPPPERSGEPVPIPSDPQPDR
jgi:hypothetical protein